MGLVYGSQDWGVKAKNLSVQVTERDSAANYYRSTVKILADIAALNRRKYLRVRFERPFEIYSSFRIQFDRLLFRLDSR